jgi:hypothetical protein
MLMGMRVLVLLMAAFLFLLAMLGFNSVASARDDGRYAQTDPATKQWFEGLKSGKGPCCADADGNTLKDTDWESINDPKKPDVHFRVYIENKWWDVQDEAVIKEPNRVGRVIVWPIYQNSPGNRDIVIRCFLPGALI